MRRCALLLLIALALALLAVGAQAQERGDAAGDPPAAPRISRLSWSGLTIRAEWNPVARATGYDLRWTPEEQRRRHLTVSAERAVDGSPAEVSALWAGRWRVEVRARIGSGPSAVRGAWSRPRIVRVYDAPPRLEVERFDGEYARLNWTGVGASYELEWGERGGAKQFARRDGRSPTLELGPLEGGKTYEFRVRARDGAGRSDYSPTAVFTPTGWRGGRPGAGYVGRIGQIYALWFPQRGAEWYELSWINAADPTETARVRVGTATSGGSRPQVPGQIGREGGFENGTWNVRVRAGPRGVWSPLYPLTLSNQPERLALELESSRELCTAGTLTEIMWKISGGSAPYALRVENSAVDVSADNARINCGALSEAEAADEDAALAAKRVTATVTDARGVRREAALEVARARALPVPTNFSAAAYRTYILSNWTSAGPAEPGAERSYALRWRERGAAQWTFVNRSFTSSMWTPAREAAGIHNLNEATVYELSVADTRTAIEGETSEVLNWTPIQTVTTLTAPTNVRATATHDTITVRWDPQLAPRVRYSVSAHSRDGSVGEDVILTPTDRHEVTLRGLPPNTEHRVWVAMQAGDQSQHAEAPSPIRTLPAPADWTAPVRGVQNVRATATHNSITVWWDPPRADALPLYVVHLFRRLADGEGPEGDEEVKVRHIEVFDATGVLLNGLAPSTTYRILIYHPDAVIRNQEITVSTTAAPAASGAARSNIVPTPPYLPQPVPLSLGWPVHLDPQRRLTADVWEWRSTAIRHHAGTDFGHRIGGDALEPLNDPVIASADGVLRIFNDVLPNDYEYVLYCPSATGSFYERFALSGVEELLADTTDEYTCRYVVSPSSGRTALVFHGSDGSGPYFTKYSHLSEIHLEQATLERSVRSSDDEIIGHRIKRGERIGYIGSSSADRTYAHLHFEIRRMPSSTSSLQLWYETKSSSLRCASGTGVGSDCEWAPNRWMASVIDPEDLLPPYPAAPFWEEAYPSLPSTFPTAAPLTLIAAAPANSPVGRVNTHLQVLVYRPEFYRLAEGPDYRKELSGRARTRPGVTGYMIRSKCVQDQRSQAATTRQLAYVVNDGAKNVSLAMVPGMSCEISVVTGNDAYPAGDAPAGLYGREISVASIDGVNQVVVGNRQATPEHPSTRVSMASLGGSDVSVLGALDPYEVDVYMLTAKRGYTYRFCVDLNRDNDCDDRRTGDETMSEDVVVQVVGNDGIVTRSNGESVEDTRDGEADLEWTAGDNGTYALVVRAGTFCNGALDGEGGPCTGDYRLEYDETLKTVCTLSGGGPVGTSEDAASVVDDGGGSSTPCRPLPPTALTVTKQTPVRLSLSWTAGTGASFHEAKKTTRANCNLETEAFGTPSPKTATSHSFTGLTPGGDYRLCVRSVRTVGDDSVKSSWAEVTRKTLSKLATPSVRPVSGITLNSATLSWSLVDDADGYEVKRTDGSDETTPKAASGTTSHPFTGLSPNTPYTFYVRAKLSTNSAVTSEWAEATATTSPAPRLTVSVSPRSASCYTGGSVSISWTISNGTAPYAVRVDGSSVSGNRKTLTCQSTAGTQTVSVTATDASTPQRSGSASVSLAVTNPPPPPPPPTLSVSASASPTSCTTGGTVNVRWSVSGASGSYTVTVDGRSASTSPTTVTCQSTAGRQSITVEVRDSSGSSESDTVYVTVTAPPSLLDCLSAKVINDFASWIGRASHCGSTTASALWTAFRNDGIQIGCIQRVGSKNEPWPKYQSGWPDFSISFGAILALTTAVCDAGGGVSGSADADAVNCAEAVKPETGAMAIDVSGFSCVIVRGGGAVQVSRGEYTLNVSLASDRDWFAFAPASYTGSSAGAFLFLDLTSGGWIALYPPDGFELERHTPADATGLPALLDAIAASAAPSVYPAPDP